VKTLIVVAHPELASSNTQPFFKAAINDLPDVTWHPLAANFDVETERRLLIQHDRIILEFPFYWYSAPARLKQWLDTVFSTKFATGNRYAMAGKELGIVVSTGDKARDFQAGAGEKFTMSELLRPFEAFANKLKMRYLPILPVHQFLYMTPDDQQLLLVRYQQYVTAPDFEHFHNQTAWFEKQLQQRIETDENHALQLEQILDVIQNQQAELDDLQWNLSVLKKEDDA
jgi:glutathione-regulated potassium-efflux system ancillary protein KefG